MRRVLAIIVLGSTLVTLGGFSAPADEDFDLLGHLIGNSFGNPVCCCVIGQSRGALKLEGALQTLIDFSVDTDVFPTFISTNGTDQSYLPVGTTTVDKNGVLIVSGTIEGAYLVIQQDGDDWSWTAWKDGVELASGRASKLAAD